MRVSCMAVTQSQSHSVSSNCPTRQLSTAECQVHLEPTPVLPAIRDSFISLDTCPFLSKKSLGLSRVATVTVSPVESLT